MHVISQRTALMLIVDNVFDKGRKCIFNWLEVQNPSLFFSRFVFSTRLSLMRSHLRLQYTAL